MKRPILIAAAAALIAIGGGTVAAQHGGHGKAGSGNQAGSGKAQAMVDRHHADVGPHRPWHTALHRAVDAPTRTPANVARDQHRHPFDTLAYFGVQPNHTVVEIWPGGGWYTEILAPYIRQGGGTYFAAVANENQHRRIQTMSSENPALYGTIRVANFPVREPTHTRVPDGTADVVLTFRNVHNWIMGAGSNNQDYSADAFRQMYAMLKPGGTLGIVDHRLPESGDAARERSSGYVRVSTVRRLAEQAGFRFAGSSEINANPRDTADWTQGVWTLPPTYRLGDQDRARYQAIGESDRMTLRFVRPAAGRTRRR